MNLNVSERKGGTYLYIEKSYRNKDGKPRKKNILTLGYLEDLKNDFEDPIAHFKEVAKQMTDEEKENRRVTVTVDMDEELPVGTSETKNLGYALPLKIYHELGIHKFLKNKAAQEDFKYNSNSIMTLLVLSRILAPGSKKKAFEDKARYFERFDFTLDDTYRSLTHFHMLSEELQRYLHESIRTRYGSDTSIIYYDVTNYYFEIKKPDELRKYGKPKQNRKKPVVQMGLAMDKDGVPLSYKLFPGNTLDKETFRAVIGEVRRNYDTGRVVVVADMGIITGDNIYYLTGNKPEKPKNGYIFSFSVRGGTKKFQEYVLDETGYRDKYGEAATDKTNFKIKERVIARDINVTMTNGSVKKKTVYEKQVVFWSRKYYLKARAERAEVIAKAQTFIANPAKYTKATSYGAATYVKNIEFDKNTGEVMGKGKSLSLDKTKIEAEERLDGYYSIVTSELHLSASEIVDSYRGLWEIEETFKITKSDLLARPVRVHDPDHIDAHFLTCFIALTILRIIQKLTNKVYSVERIVKCLNKIECMHEYENTYLFGHRSGISDTLGKVFNIDFTKKRMRLTDIKKLLGDVKKP